MQFDEWWNSEARRRAEREGRERFKEQIERRADPASRREPKPDNMPVARTRLTTSQIDERTAIAVEAAIEHERASQLQLVKLLAEETFAALDHMRDRINELRSETAGLKAGIAELRAAHFNEKAAKAEEKSAPTLFDLSN